MVEGVGVGDWDDRTPDGAPDLAQLTDQGPGIDVGDPGHVDQIEVLI